MFPVWPWTSRDEFHPSVLFPVLGGLGVRKVETGEWLVV